VIYDLCLGPRSRTRISPSSSTVELILIKQIQNESFLSERKDDPRIKSRENKLQEFDQAYWKWREIVDNAEEGIKFYQSFGEMLGGFKGGCIQFLNSRRVDVGYVSLPLLFFFLPLSPVSPPSL
jgi:hypothetical protein